jgi:hypothetical protein
MQHKIAVVVIRAHEMRFSGPSWDSRIGTKAITECLNLHVSTSFVAASDLLFPKWSFPKRDAMCTTSDESHRSRTIAL